MRTLNANLQSVQGIFQIFMNIVAQNGRILTARMAYDKVSPPFIEDPDTIYEYVRWRSLDLVGGEIYANEIPGNVAEAGVACGHFSRLINKRFPDRKLYLFDTFCGFDKDQFKRESERGLISERYKNMFDKNSVQVVLDALPHPEQAIPCPGIFEESCKSVDDTFAFVSLDMDLYEPMSVALEYFYPRVSSGGYLFLHDYNHADIHGVKPIIREYEARHGLRLPRMPIPDEGGTIVIMKP